MGSGKKKIEIKKIDDKNKNFVAFSKRTRGLFKKAHQFCYQFPGLRFAGVIFSPAGNIYVDGDLTLLKRYSKTTAAARRNGEDFPAAAENCGGESTLASLITDETTRAEEIDDLNELRRRKDYLDGCKEKVFQMMKAMQPVEEAKELQPANHAKNQDCVSDNYRSGITEEVWEPPQEIQFVFGVEKEPIVPIIPKTPNLHSEFAILE